MRLSAAIAVTSAAALAYEILLIRLFAIVDWHHLAFLVISLALLGYGASGTLLALGRERLLRHFDAAAAASAAGFGATSIGAFLLSQRFCAATGIGLALTRHGAESPRLYRADLLGGGISAAAVTALLLAAPLRRCSSWRPAASSRRRCSCRAPRRWRSSGSPPSPRRGPWRCRWAAARRRASGVAACRSRSARSRWRRSWPCACCRSGLPAPAKVAMSIALIAPLAFVMGMPFPSGLRRLPADDIRWAWGINGTASVIASMLATLVAVHFGFSVLVLLAAALYGCAFLASASFSSASS